MFNQYLNQFPATDQQIIQELLRQYQSADPQTKALAQRRLEPYTQQLLQMSTADRMQRRQDAFQAGPAMPEESMSFQVNQPAVTLLESDPVEVIQQAQKPALSRDFSVQSRMTPQQLIGSGIPTENPTTLGSRSPLENREKLPPLRIPAEPPPPIDPQAMEIIAEARRKRDAAQPVQRITPPQLPTTARANTAVQMPARPQTPAVQAQSAPAQGGGLLDVDMDFFDDPTRMGLLQAGLGLLSAPRYSTNPNDVTLSSALARGLGGFIKGYGGTRKRLTEEERQKLEDEYKRSQMEFDKLYKTALTNEAIGRTEQMKALLAQPAKDQKEWEEKVREIYPNPDNKTGQALIAAGPVEGAKKLAKIAGGMTETERTGLLNKIKNDSVLPEDDKAMLLEMVNERDFEGKLSNSSVAINNAINQLKDDLKPKSNLFGDSLQAQAAQYLIDEQGADPQQLAERIMEGRSTPQVVSVPVDPNDPTKGSRLMLLDRNNLAMDEIPGGTTVPPKKEINATDIRNYNDYQITLNQINQSIGLLKDEEAIKGVGKIQGYYPGMVIPAKAKQLRALMADLTSDRLNEKFGAALTKQEFDRIKAAVPLETDSEETLQVKLNTLKDIFQNKLGLLEQQYPSSRYRPFPNINAVGLDGYNEAIGN